MSGLLAAYRLQQAGVDVRGVREGRQVGGTWWENTYPGCRVDNPNHNYSYSFAQRHDWPMHYSTQDVLAGYFRDFAEEHGLLEHIRLRHRGRVGDVVGRRPPLDAAHPSGRTARVEDVDVDAVISATGQLNRPHLPEIDGTGHLRGAGVPLGAVARRPGPRRQAGGRHRHRCQRRAVHPDRRRAGRRAGRSSSGHRPGSPRRPTTTTPSRTGCAGCTGTCRTTANGTASGSSG